MANVELEEEGGESDDGEHEEVGDQEGASTVLEAQIGEPPDVAETNSISETGQKEVQLPRPIPPLYVLILNLELLDMTILLLREYFTFYRRV